MNVRIHIFVSLLFVVLFMGCDDLDDTGFEQFPHSIVNGTETNYETWRGVIGVLYCPPGGCESLCTGTLIDPQVVLTAAHCVYSISDDIDVQDPKHLYIQGGPDLNLSYTVGSEIVQHPDWTGIVAGGSVDLAMITLNTPITSVETYGITVDEPIVGITGKIVGYGYSDDSIGGGSGIHRVGDTTIQRFHRDEIFELGDPMSICVGDSGGPFLVEQDGYYNVMGVASFGTNPENCPADYDGYFTTLFQARPWINDTMLDMVGHGINPIPEPGGGIDPGTVDDAGADSGTIDETGSTVGGGGVVPVLPYPGEPATRSATTDGCRHTPGNPQYQLIARILSLFAE